MTQFDMHKLAIAKTSAAKNKAPDIMLNLSIFEQFHSIPPSRKIVQIFSTHIGINKLELKSKFVK